MEFLHFVATLEDLEKTSSLNEMTEILADLFKNADPGEIDILCYFVVGDIAAGYQEVTLDIGEKNVLSAIALGLDVEPSAVESRLRRQGDLGDIAAGFDVPSRKVFQDIFAAATPLTVQDVHRGLMQITQAEGTGSAEVKKKILAALIGIATPAERRYLVRLAMGSMRLGAGDMTVLDALATAFLGSKHKRSALEQAYYISSDIGYVAGILAKSGITGVKRIRVALNRPIHPMLSQRVPEMKEILEKIGSDTIAVEEKYDGERIQAHKDGDSVRLFSRRLSDVTEQFPDVVQQVKEHIRATSAILDGEAVAYNRDKRTYYPFQKLMQRRRKYQVSEYTSRIPVRYMVFDLLYRDGSSWMGKNYPERVETLHKILESSELIAPAGSTRTGTTFGIQDYFNRCLDAGLEGVICKSTATDSFYEAGSRSWQWIKWKKSYGTALTDTLDLVVIGGYLGRGKRKGTYGSLLCAAYNEENDIFQTICGLGAGFSDEQLAFLPEKFRNVEVDEQPARCMVREQKYPDQWFVPTFVLEVLGAEITESTMHTCNWDEEKGSGMGLRFPRFIRWRPEKSPEQATSAEEIREMFQGQQKKS
jgi:DNA ligase-1